MSDGPYPAEAEIREDLDVPSPRRGRNSGATRWGIIEELEVGQSAIWTLPDEEELKRFRNILSSTAHRYGKKLDRNFTIRTLEPAPDGPRIGIWRLPNPVPEV